MQKQELITQMIEENNGYLFTSDVVARGISKTYLAEYVRKFNLERAAHGIYLSQDAWPDFLYLLYLKNRNIVFSHETALFLHGLMEKEPSEITVTVKRGYNATHLREKSVHVSQIKQKWFPVGIEMKSTGFGNKVAVYDMDRTICDVIRNRKSMDIQVFGTAMKEYIRNDKKNLSNLMQYAKEFKIEESVRSYIAVMM